MHIVNFFGLFICVHAAEEKLAMAQVILVESQKDSGAVAGLIDFNGDAGCIDSTKILERYNRKCIVEITDAWRVCAKLACKSVLCLPSSDFFSPYNITRDENNTIALRAASIQDDVMGVRRELSDGADVDATESVRLRTPLMLAALEGALHASIELLNSGANPLLFDTQGRTALDMARSGDASSAARAKRKTRERNRNALIALLESATKKAQIAMDRLDESLHTSDLEAKLRLRAKLATKSYYQQRAEIAANQLHYGIGAPLCLFASTAQSFADTDHAICDANATFSPFPQDDVIFSPSRRCELHIFTVKPLIETLDLGSSLPSFAAGKISDAVREKNIILVYDDVSYKTNELPLIYSHLEDVTCGQARYTFEGSLRSRRVAIVPGPPLSFSFSSDCSSS